MLQLESLEPRLMLSVNLPEAFLAEATPFSFVSMADSRGADNGVNSAVLGTLADLVAAENAEFVVFQGDLINGSSDTTVMTSQLNHWRDVMAPLYSSDMYGAKVYAGVGNHEIWTTSQEAVWQSIFTELPDNGPAGETYMTYSFDYGNSHFIMMDTNRAGEAHTINYDWLAADLAATTAEHIFVMGHEPAFPVGPHLGSSLDVYPEQRDAFWQLMSDNNVDIYFTGHEHLYNHIEVGGIHQVLNGTSGAPIYGGYGGDFYHYALVTVDGGTVSVDVIDDSGTVRDSFNYTKVVAENIVSVEATDAAAAEVGLDPGAFTVTRTGDTAAPLTVYYAVAGTATQGADFGALSGSVTIGAGSASAVIVVNPVDDALAEGAETVQLIVTEDPGYGIGFPSTAIVTIADHPYQQDPGTDGIVSIEAEHFDNNITRSSHEWTEVTPSGYSGEGAIEAAPNVGTSFNKNYSPISPQVDYQINFTQTGTHYIWVRGYGPGKSDDSIHIGLDGQEVLTADHIQKFGSSWTWANITKSRTAAVVEITDPGLHTINAWMWEDGFVLDKIVVTTNPNYTPTGTGPVESLRGEGAVIVNVIASDANGAEEGNDTGAFTVSRTGDTTDTLTVFYTVSGTATEGADFAALSGSVTIAAGSASALVTVTPIDDDEIEGSETVQLVLSADAAYVTGSPSVADVVIADNDAVVLEPYQQDAGADGIVSIEVEHFDANTAGDNHEWAFVTPSGYAGEGALEAAPNIGGNLNKNYSTLSPQLDFQVNFVNSGTHYIWVRGYGPGRSDDTVHIGLDGQEIATSDHMVGFGSSWTWSNATKKRKASSFTISAPGVHTVNAWMWEDGFVIDKIVITTNPDYIPTGFGPAESTRGPSAPMAAAASFAFAAASTETTNPLAALRGNSRSQLLTKGSLIGRSTHVRASMLGEDFIAGLLALSGQSF